MDSHDLLAPTYFDLNEFTWAFHEIVVTYGTPLYREINPTAFNIVTFPFLFGIMFGDIGHGALLFLIGTYFCLKKDIILLNSPNLIMLVKARYLLLLMGAFALYCGLIYNDFMSLPMNFFGSCYTNVYDKSTSNKEADYTVIAEKDCVYPFGVDPKWYVSKNELSFLNSLKMKIAVILGVG